METGPDLEKAISAIRTGDRLTGQRLLVAILKVDPKNEQAWLWLAQAMPNDKQRMAALEQCLKVIPHSQAARQALDQLLSQPAEEAAPSPTPPPVEPHSPPHRSSLSHLPPAQPTPLSDRIAQIEAAKKGTLSPEGIEAEVSQPSGSPELEAAAAAMREPVSAPAEIAPALRKAGSAVKAAGKPRRSTPLNFTLWLILSMLALVILVSTGWMVWTSYLARQQDPSNQAMLATGIMKTQDAAQTLQAAGRLTQEALPLTPTPTTPPAATRTPRPTATATATPTPVPTLAGITSLIGPENVASLSRSTALPGPFNTGLAFSADGRLLAGASSLGIGIWDAHTLAPLRQIFLENDAEAVTFSPDGQVLYFSQVTESNQSLFFSAAASDFSTLLAGIVFPDPTVGLFVTPQNPVVVLASYSNSSNILLLDPADGTVLTILDHTGGLLAASLNPRSGELATAGINDLVQVWNLESRQVDTVLSGHAADVIALAFSPDGALLASASQDGVIQVWNCENWNLAATLKDGSLPVQALAFSPDHQLLVSADTDNQLRAWDIASATVLESFAGPAGLKDIAFSVDGGILALAGELAVEIWTLPAP